MLKKRKIFIFNKYSRFYLNDKTKKFKKIKNKFFLSKNKENVIIKSVLIKNSGGDLFFFIVNKFFFFKLLKTSFFGFFLKKQVLYKNKIIFSIFKYFFLKIKFYGKTFKWIFTKKKIRFKVQKAHKTFVLFKHFRFKKKRKFKFKLRVFLSYEKKNIINIIKKIKYINLFTKKGLRVLKTKLRKKKGKVSTYM